MSDGQALVMRIVAEVVDKWSRPLRAMREGFGNVKPNPNTDKLRNQFRGLRDAISDARREISDGLSPALGALNLRTLTVGGAIAAIVHGVGRTTVALDGLRLISKESGVSTNKIRELQFAGEEVGASADQVAGGVQTFARNMKELRAGIGGTLSSLFQNGDKNVRNFALSLRSVGSNEEALGRVLKFLDRINNPLDRQRFIQAFGLPAELARVTSEGLDEAGRKVGKTSKQMEDDARRLMKSFRELRQDWSNFQIALMETGAFSWVSKELGKFAKDINSVAKTLRLIRDGKYADAFREGFGTLPPPKTPGMIEADIYGKREELKKIDGIIADREKRGIDHTAPSAARRRIAGEIIDLERKLKEATEEGARKGSSEGVQDALKKMMFQGGSRGGFGGGDMPRPIPASFHPGASGGIRSRMPRYRDPDAGGPPAPGDYSGGTGSLKGNASSWMEFAQRVREKGGLGLSREQAAGLVGNLQAESGKNIPSWGPSGDRGTAWGSAQWRGDRLRRLMRMFPDSYKTVEAQQKFMRWEMDNTERRAYAAIRRARTPEETAAMVDRFYERSSGAHRARRQQNARRLFDAAKNNPVVGGAAKVEGGAKVQIDLNGFPKGTKVKPEASGIFDKVVLNRGRAMPVASESD